MLVGNGDAIENRAAQFAPVIRFFSKLEHFRAVATRYNKRADTFLSAVLIAATVIWWLN